MPTSKLRVVLVSEMLQPYRIPVFNRIAEREDIDFHVLLLSLREPNRKWELPLDACRFRYEVLPVKDIYIRALDWGLHLNWGVKNRLKELSPEVVVGTGYVSPAYLVAQRHARKAGAGYVLWSGSTTHTARIGKGPLRLMKEGFIRRCNAFLSYGSEATRTLMERGASPKRIVTGCNCVDNESFARMAELARREPDYPRWRARFPERVVLFVGQMLERKGVMDLVEAFQRAACPNLGLVLVGDGPEWERYRESYRGVENLFWEGYVQSSAMGRYLAAADALVMPSRIEVWGLVVNEAMAAGVPVIATTCSGATLDLIEDGRTGRRFEAGDVSRLAALLESVADESGRWTEMGENARARIQSCSPERYAEAFVQACRLALQR